MAERRMFIRNITEDDNFMSLSASAQALYLHLCMSADDDGFNNQVAVSMFRAHASTEDLRNLLEKRYLLQFESGVIVIKHWRMANALRKDRYTPTKFQEELAMLDLKENGAYTFGNHLATKRQPNGNPDKISIDKDSIDKVREDNNINKSASAPVYFPNDAKLDETFKAFIDNRKKLKAPMTAHAIDLAIAKLMQLSNNDNDTAVEILNRSILNGWKGLFPLTEKKSGTMSEADAWLNA